MKHDLWIFAQCVGVLVVIPVVCFDLYLRTRAWWRDREPRYEIARLLHGHKQSELMKSETEGWRR